MREYLKFKYGDSKKTCGYIDYAKQIYISRRTQDHQFHKFGEGFGCSVIILNYLRSKGIETILIVFLGQLLKTTVQDYYDFGKRYADGKDKQLILPFNDFKLVGHKEEKQITLGGKDVIQMVEKSG